jgi:phosphopantothenoylcysteine decarboxylase/phosphopantothenate--cysteine ligase
MDGIVKLVLGVTGAIAASLIPGWVVYLRQIRGWEVQVLLSEAATRFVSSTALEATSGNPVYVGKQWMDSGRSIHKEVVRDSDVLAVSPCTLNTMARLGAGMADDAISLAAAFALCPVILFPAFGSSEVGPLWDKLKGNIEDVGYHLASMRTPATKTVDGSVTPKQGFPTIDLFEKEVHRVMGRHAPS